MEKIKKAKKKNSIEKENVQGNFFFFCLSFFSTEDFSFSFGAKFRKTKTNNVYIRIVCSCAFIHRYILRYVYVRLCAPVYLATIAFLNNSQKSWKALQLYQRLEETVTRSRASSASFGPEKAAFNVSISSFSGSDYPKTSQKKIQNPSYLILRKHN